MNDTTDEQLSNEERDVQINETVVTKEYAPAVFEAIRQMDGINAETVLDSLNTEKNHK